MSDHEPLSPFRKNMATWNGLKTFYRERSTAFSLDVEMSLKELQENERKRNRFFPQILVCGSVAFGQAIRGISDLDVLFYGDVTHQPTWVFQIGAFIEKLGLSRQMLSFTSIHQPYVESLIQKVESRMDIEDIPFSEDYAFFKFISNYWTTTPLNNELESVFERGLALEYPAINAFHQIGGLTSIIGPSEIFFEQSFGKYRSRLIERGYEIPKWVEESQKLLVTP